MHHEIHEVEQYPSSTLKPFRMVDLETLLPQHFNDVLPYRPDMRIGCSAGYYEVVGHVRDALKVQKYDVICFHVETQICGAMRCVCYFGQGSGHSGWLKGVPPGCHSPWQLSIYCILPLGQKFRLSGKSAFRTPVWEQKKPEATASGFLLKKLLLDDPDLDFRVHVRVQPDRDAVDSQGANRLVQLDLPFFNVKALLLELLGDVG